MKRIQYIYILITAVLVLAGCSKEDLPNYNLTDNEIAISYSTKRYKLDDGTRSGEFRSTDEGSQAERDIDNLYILLFKSDGTVEKFYVDDNFTDGEWLKTGTNATKPYVKLKLAPGVAAERNVHVVANVSAALKAKLDANTLKTEANLKDVFDELNTSWSPTLKTPILMSGSASHDFTVKKELESVELVRVLAKVELEITLPDHHKSTAESDYKYQFINFDKNTYVLKPEPKKVSAAGDLISSPNWQAWTASGDVTTFTKGSDNKVEKLTLVTYLNEVEDAGTMIEIQLPHTDGGLLPPPEFGPETFKLPLPDKVERNHWYKYDIEL